MILQALSHSIRRNILRLLRESSKTYTDISDHFDISRGKLNYHLNQMAGFLEKTEKGLYRITSLGKKALDILDNIRHTITGDDQTRIKQAYVSQKSKSSSILMKGINIWIGAVIFAMFIHIVVAYFAFVDPQTPWIVYVVLSVIFGIEIILLRWLFGLRSKAPNVESKLKAHFKDD